MKFKMFMSLVAMAALFGACRPGSDGAKQATEQEVKMLVDGTDSIQVSELVTTYMDLLKEGKAAEAVDMLVMINPENINAEPQPASDEYKKQLVESYNSLPLKEWSLREYKFNQAHNSTVVCDVVVGDGIRSKMVLKPVNYVGEWRLSIMESANGDY